MNATKKTQVELVKLQNIDNEQLVQALFDMDADTYCQFKFDTGISYARRMTMNDEMGYDMLIKTRFFWQWWKNEWAKREAEFLELYSATSSTAKLYDQYLFTHSVYRLCDDNLMSKKAISMVGFSIDEYMRSLDKEAATV